jgi:putative flippase GtrA
MSDASTVRRLERPALPAFAEHLLALAPKGLIRFLVVGVGGLSVDVAVLWLMKDGAGLSHAWARVVSLCVATLVTWALNRHFTFGESGGSRRWELLRYIAVAAVAQSVNYVTYLAVLEAAPHIDYRLAAVIGAVVATGFSYTGQRFFTFRRKG